VEVSELSRALGVSLSTVRRDLEALEKMELIRRVHGGAVRMDSRDEPPLVYRAAQNADTKRRIGEAAAGLVQDGETVIILDGTTTEAMIPFLASKAGITVITNAINIAYRLSRYPQISCIVLGGWLSHPELSLLGHLTEQAMQDLSAAKLFRGIFGISASHGLTGTYPPEVQTQRFIMGAAQQIIVLADHSKFGQMGPVRLVPIQSVSIVVTDSLAPADEVAALRAHGIQVIQA